MTLNKFRGALYAIAKFIGDIQAVRSKKPGAVEKRVARRIAGRITGKILGKIFK